MPKQFCLKVLLPADWWVWIRISPISKRPGHDYSHSAPAPFSSIVITANLIEVLERHRIITVAGILLDLGLSTEQLKVSGRGFSFGGDETLDMRMNPDAQTMTAADLLNTTTEAELSRLFWELGEERWARRIARRVVQVRRHTPLATTAQLVDLIRQVVPAKAAYGRIHPATRIFQALRIAVNQELEKLSDPLSPKLLPL